MIDTINNKHYNPEDLHADLRNWLIGAVDDGCLDKRDLIVGFVKFLSSDEMIEFCRLNEIDIDWLAEWAD
jgi:hypothetical protein|tara:strand:- start:948 stop:1157 length:210 start_codon:yes stop_codon:yes gene_type:complete